MRQSYLFPIVLSKVSNASTQQLGLFALLNLRLVQSLASGILSATEAVQLFYNAESCFYVRKHLRNREANTTKRIQRRANDSRTGYAG